MKYWTSDIHFPVCYTWKERAMNKKYYILKCPGQYEVAYKIYIMMPKLKHISIISQSK